MEKGYCGLNIVFNMEVYHGKKALGCEPNPEIPKHLRPEDIANDLVLDYVIDPPCESHLKNYFLKIFMPKWSHFFTFP